MGVAIKQNTDGSAGMIGSGVGNTSNKGEYINIDTRFAPTSVSGPISTFSRDFRVHAITGRVEVSGTDASAVSAIIYKAPAGTALASGTPLHTGSFNLKGTASGNQTMSLVSDAVSVIQQGDTIGVVYTGTLTAATGCISIWVSPA